MAGGREKQLEERVARLEALLLAQREQFEAELKREREKVEYLIRQLYGSKSEKLDPGQLEMMLDPDGAKKSDAAGPEEEGPAAEAKPKHSGKRRKQRLRDSMAGDIRKSGYVQADETPIDYLQAGAGKAQTGYLWTYHAPGEELILYDWQASRAHDCLDAILRAPVTEPGGEDFTGLLQTDGYAAYRTWLGKQPAVAITHASCLAHIRREFLEAAADHPRLGGWILCQIGHLYAIERRLRKSWAGPASRHAVRRAESLPIYRRLGRLFEKLIARHAITPRSPLGKALRYAHGQWPLLLPALHDGRAEIDNNLVENGIRPTKLGARNWLFSGRESTGWQSAVIYTLVENVRRAGLDPEAYLRWVFERLPGMTNQDDLRTLLPAGRRSRRLAGGERLGFVHRRLPQHAGARVLLRGEGGA